MAQSGKLLRLNRILDPRTKRGVIVAFDHGLMLGPIPGLTPSRDRLRQFVEGGADAILMSPGMLRACADLLAGTGVGIIVRLDWTNMWRAPDLLGFAEGRTCALAAVEDAVRWGADAVLTYLFVGLDDPAAEAEEVRRNAEVNRACERLGMVHIVESMARGQRVRSPNRKDFVAFHTRVASELGADLIKTDILDTEAETREVVDASLAPVLLAGGAKMEDARALEIIAYLVRAGAAGVIFGRNVFQSQDPAAFLRAACRAIHQE